MGSDRFEELQSRSDDHLNFAVECSRRPALVLTSQQLKLQQTVEETYRSLRYELIMTELEVAITFCEIAATTANDLRRQGNKVNAETAYTAAIGYMRWSGLTADMLLKIQEKTRKLKSVWAQCSSDALRPLQTDPLAETAY